VVVVGLFLVGFALVALFWWMPVWQMGSFGSIEELLGYFVVVMSLLFGVFMAANDSERMRLLVAGPALVSGAAKAYAECWKRSLISCPSEPRLSNVNANASNDAHRKQPAGTRTTSR